MDSVIKPNSRILPSVLQVPMTRVLFEVIVADGSSGGAESWSAIPTGPSDMVARMVCWVCIT